ncbi:transglutaminase domain-containing protein [Kribbella sp. NPDC006257]|uniref:transglutaminase domain-containing protein n=1 Tax=Kribbella sp. NPDC006257 TaxID=3156738 RepID=UPI0033AE0C58
MSELRDDLPPRELAELRLRAEQFLRDKNDQPLLDLVVDLRGDDQWWAHLWGPGAALAAHRLGSPQASALLAEAVAAGFSQPELFEGELEEAFGADPDWSRLHREMQENIPLPALELTDWPDAGPVGPLELYTIDADRESALLDRLPAATDSAWDTATRMLEWVRTRWEHANDHVENPDALNVLERVDAGARFACVEYSIVLSQVLNAVRIPARRLELRQANHHVGVGRGHVVSEAWIDDLDRWVLLDGQNGSYWAGADGQPLGVRDLQQLTEPPAFVGARGVESLSTQEAASWFSYFASVTTTGYTWSEGPFAPVFQGIGIIRTPRLVHDGDLAYPSLSALTTGLGGKVDAPTVSFTHAHPYGTGIAVNGEPVEDYPLDMTPGTHELAVTIATPYGETAPQYLRYLVRG